MCKERGDPLGKLRWDKESALSGDPDSLWDVRTFYEHRDGAAMDLPEAYAWLSLFEDSFTTRKNSEELACFQLNPESSKYRTKSEELKALMSAHQIEQGDLRYQDLVGQRLKWIRKKAEAGAAGDQHDLGWCHRDGYGLPQDRAEGVRWWRMAAEQGERRAQNNLGHCLKYAEGTEQNHEEAVSWFHKAAESGSSAAQYSLGHSYCMGLGVPQDYIKGAKWIRKSAEAGDRVAQQNMGFLYENGWGVPRDNAQAIAWYRFAARGHGRAKEEADRLASLMTPAELTKSVELLNELEAKGGRRDEESV
jgi:TPR repeat protein